MPYFRGLFALLVLVSLTGCESSDDKIKQLANVQGQAQADNQVEAQKAYLEQKAKTMEADLEQRQRFYQAVAGIYEGTVRVSDTDYNIRFTLVPSLPRYVPSDRVRTPEEVAADLEGLNFNVQVVQWNPQSQFAAVGCLVQQVRPDLVRGRIDVVSSSCPNLYSIHPALLGAESADAATTAALAARILGGGVTSVDVLSGQMQPTSTAAINLFTARRVQP